MTAAVVAGIATAVVENLPAEIQAVKLMLEEFFPGLDHAPMIKFVVTKIPELLASPPDIAPDYRAAIEQAEK